MACLVSGSVRIPFSLANLRASRTMYSDTLKYLTTHAQGQSGAIVRTFTFWLVFNESSFSFPFINNINLSKSSAFLCMSFSITVSFVSSWEVSSNLKMSFTISFCFRELHSSLSRAALIFVVLVTAWVFKGDISMIPKLSFNISLCSTICKDVSNSLTLLLSHSVIPTSSSARSLVFWLQLRHSFLPGVTLIPLFQFFCHFKWYFVPHLASFSFFVFFLS